MATCIKFTEKGDKEESHKFQKEDVHLNRVKI